MSNHYGLIYLHAITPIHSGTGQDAAIIDLPVAREKATGWPYIPASSLKGVLRAQHRDTAPSVYGSEDYAGALCFGDQRILCLPVRSFFGTFAWITCPFAVNRVVRDAGAMGVDPGYLRVEEAISGDAAQVCSGSRLVHDGKLYLEDIDLVRDESACSDALAASLANLMFHDADEKDGFMRRFAVVSDETFNFFSETAIEVTARVRLDENSKTVESRGLWYEEAVPAETIFCGAVLVADHACGSGQNQSAYDAIERIKTSGSLIQIGGKASVGRGLCRVVVA